MKRKSFLSVVLVILLLITGGLFFNKFLTNQKLATNISSTINNASTTNPTSSALAVNQNTVSSTTTTTNSQMEEKLNELLKPDHDKFYINTVINFHPTIIVTSSTKVVYNSKYNYKLTTSIPIFSGLSNKESEKFLNNKIKEIIKKETDENIYFAKQDHDAFNVDSLNLSDKTYISFNYRIYIGKNGVISLQIISGLYRRTVKGGGWSINSIVFDSVNNKEVSYKDVFTEDYSIKIKEIIKKYIELDYVDTADIAFSNFFFTKNGMLLILYPTSSVGGIFDVFIEWKDLAGYLNDDFVNLWIK